MRIENWYEDIKEFTFATTVFDLNIKEAKTLVSYKKFQQMLLMNMDYLGKEKDPNFQLSLDDKTLAEANKLVDAELTYDELEALKAFKTKLQTAINTQN